MRRIARVTILGLALAAGGCLPEAVVDVTTTVYHDGSIDRSVRIEGRTGEGEIPTGRDWPRDVLSIGLARPDSWPQVDVQDGVLEAHGFFRAAEDVPALLQHHLDDGSVVRDRGGVTLRIDDLLLLRRWSYVETWGDPFGAADVAAAVDELLDLFGRVVREDLRRDLGDDVDLAPFDALLTGTVRQALLEVLQVERRFADIPDDASRAHVLALVLARHGVEIRSTEDADFWDAATPVLMDAFSTRLAAALSDAERPVTPDDFAFHRRRDDLGAWLDEAATHAFGSPDELERRVTLALGAMQGGYGGVLRTRFRFRSRVTLPGRLLRTDATSDGGGVVRFFRGESMLSHDVVWSAVSIEPDAERLRALGARQSFEALDLLQIEELLGRRDPQRNLRAWVERAIDERSIAILRDTDTLPDDIESAARELADLLEGIGPGA
jgi:hypothetical protein